VLRNAPDKLAVDAPARRHDRGVARPGFAASSAIEGIARSERTSATACSRVIVREHKRLALPSLAGLFLPRPPATRGR
jgi:hypothetical protein